MSVLDARLDRLMPTLKAKERAMLVLGSLKAGTPEGPRWRQTMPTSQYAEFNRYIGLMNACNVQIGALIMLVNQSVEKLELRFAWFTSLVLWGRHAEDLEDYIDRYTKPVGKHARVELLRMKREEPWRSLHVRSQGEEPPLWSRLAEALQERMKAELPCHWQQLRAVEMVLDEVAEEFGGEDVLKPTLRQEIAAAKEKALAVQVTLQEWTGAFELPEPDPAALKETRRLIKRAAET